ncbi:hypothetical protein QI549_13830, partial [Staphylococcus aureus]|nr:hypothetical protein [Staphylococcus aureus]
INICYFQKQKFEQKQQLFFRHCPFTCKLKISIKFFKTFPRFSKFLKGAFIKNQDKKKLVHTRFKKTRNLIYTPTVFQTPQSIQIKNKIIHNLTFF